MVYSVSRKKGHMCAALSLGDADGRRGIAPRLNELDRLSYRFRVDHVNDLNTLKLVQTRATNHTKADGLACPFWLRIFHRHDDHKGNSSRTWDATERRLPCVEGLLPARLVGPSLGSASWRVHPSRYSSLMRSQRQTLPPMNRKMCMRTYTVH